MLFDDNFSVLSCARTQLQNGVANKDELFHDTNDSEVDKWFSSSPPIASFVYLDNSLSSEVVKSSDNKSDKEENKKKIDKLNKNNAASIKRLFPELTGAMFEKQAIAATNVTGSLTTPSLLSSLLAAGSQQASKSNLTPLTIFLPNREAMSIEVSDSNTVQQVIQWVLQSHLKASLTPLLRYDMPEKYELRLHEGDGEPDEDFQALDYNKKLKHYGNLNEFCLCVVDGIDDLDECDIDGGPVATDNTASEYEIRVRLGHLGSNSDDEPAALLTLRVPLSSGMTNGATPLVSPSTLPHEVDDNTTFRHLLQWIAKKHRLRIYTDVYVFNISQEDQTRLMFAFPIMEMDVKILSVGTKDFELQNKVFADSPKVLVKPEKSAVSMRSHKTTTTVNTMSTGSNLAGLGPASAAAYYYNDATAAVYEEWSIVKKNKFGRRQERVFGVDGSYVYNSKRSNTSDRSAVQRAQRDISDILKLSYVTAPTGDVNTGGPLNGDNRTFRITWDDDKAVYDIEYTTDTVEECKQIMAKLEYLRGHGGNRRRRV